MKIKDVIRYLKIYKKHLGNQVFYIFIIALLVAFFESLGISMLLPLLQNSGKFATEESGRFLRIIYEFLAILNISNSQIGILIFMGFLFLLKGFMKFFEGLYTGLLMEKLLKGLTLKVFDLYQNTDYQYFITKNTGHYINVINSQVNRMVRLLKNLTSVFTNIIVALTYLIFAVFIAWEFSLMAFFIGIIILIAFKKLNHYLANISRKMAAEYTNLNKFLVQTLQAFKYILSTAQTPYFRKQVKKTVKKLARYLYIKTKWNGFTRGVQEPITIVFIITVVIIQTYYLENPIEPIVVALLLFYRGIRYTIAIQQTWQQTVGVSGSAEMVENELKSLQKHIAKNGNKRVEHLNNTICFNNVSFTYNNSYKPSIKQLSFEIPLNKTLAFVGASGAGKTTLVDMITLMLEPTHGEILINNTDSKKINKESWRAMIGYVSQETTVFDDTIANNICLWAEDPANPKTQEAIAEAAKKAYAWEFINELEYGLNTIVGERGVKLSGGQKQRLFIARELYKEPRLLILDEATSALDTKSEKFIQNSIDALKGSLTVIIIAHRLSTIKNADLIFVLDNGELIEQGNYEELSRQNSRFSSMIEIQNL